MTFEEQQILIAEAEAQTTAGKYAEAETTVRAVLSEPGIAPIIQAQALIALSESLWHRGMAKDALVYAEEAVAAATEAGSKSEEANSLRNGGIVYGILGDYEKAVECFSRALALYDELGQRSAVGGIINNIGIVYKIRGEYVKALEFFTRALALHKELGQRSGIAAATVNIGIVYERLGEYAKALEYGIHAIVLHEELGQPLGVATANVGIVYWGLGDHAKALEYFTRSLALYEELGDPSGVALVTGNIGGVYECLGEYAKSLASHTRSLALHEELGERDGVARVTGNIGNVYWGLGDHAKALEYFTRSLALHEELGMCADAALVIGNIGALYAQKEFADYNPTKAETLLQQAISLNQELGTKQSLYENHKSLANFYSQEGRWEEAFQQFKKYHELYQEVQSEESQKKAAQVEQQRQIAEMEKRTAAERADAEATKRVLHNILPPTIAQRVVSGEERIAESFESVTVLFADIVGFTVLSQHISATELVSGLDVLFSQFDELAEKHGLEKIKTIGDAYMAVSGLPEPREDHAESAAKMAMEMVEVVKEFAGLGGDSHLQVRIGLHTGEVVAGIIGKKKFAYDLWGDAVNTAARMESHGEAGKIHVSEEFVSAAGERFSFTERGEMEVKGKGVMRTFFLQSTSTP